MVPQPKQMSAMRLLAATVLALAIIASAFVAVGSAPARSTAGPISALPTPGCVIAGCSMHLSTGSGSHGNTVRAIMKGYYPNDFAQVWFWNGVTGSTAALVSSGPTSVNGNFALSFRVPNQAVGHYVVFVTDFTGDNQSAFFNLTKMVTLGRSGSVSSNFDAGVWGFLPNTVVSFTMGGTGVGAVAPCKTTGHGSFTLSSCILYVPNLAAGAYTLVATDGTNFARVQFTVI